MSHIASKALVWTAAGAGALFAARQVVRARRFFPLDGRTVLITGGSRGLGLVMAREFAGQGARLALCARDIEELERATRELSGAGAEVIAIPCDLTRIDEVEAMIGQVLDRFGQIDVLVNNAGTIQVGPMEVTTIEDYEEALRTHFWAPLYTTFAVLPGMRRKRAGRIVNISSIGGKISVPHLLPYSASKFALCGFSEGLRAELAGSGILVTTVIPGLMRTGSPRHALFKGQHRAEYAWFSISDSLPVLSTSAMAAARQIVRATQYGDAQLVLTLPAQLAVVFRELFPELSADVLGLANRLLPGPGGIGSKSVPGKESTSFLAPSWATKLTDAAAERNNEMSSSGNDRTEGHRS